MKVRCDMNFAVSAIALALAGTSLSPYAYAQDAQADVEEGDEATSDDAANSQVIVVSGIRSAFDNALDTKRFADQISDTLSVDDLGAFPDTNIAESIQRLPGVQLTRNGRGEGNGYIINGISQIQTTVNGRHIVSQGSRSATLLDYSSDLIGGLTVFKTATANQIEGGLGGLIDVNMGRAFDYDGRRIALSLEGSHQVETNANSPSFAGVYSDIYDTSVGRIGLVVGGQYEVFNSAGFKNEVFGFGERSDLFDLNGNGVTGDAEDALVVATGDLRQRHEVGERVRASAYGSLQWEVDDTTELYADVMYFKSHGRSSQANLSSRNQGTGGVGTPTFIGDTNYAADYTLANVALRAQPLETDNPYTTTVYGAGFKKTLGNLDLKLDFSYMKSDGEFRFHLINFDLVAPEVGFSLDGDTPYLDVQGLDLNDPANYAAPYFFQSYSFVKHDAPAIQLDATYHLDSPLIESIDFGAYWTNITQERANSGNGGSVSASDTETLRQMLVPLDSIVFSDDMFTDLTLPTNVWLTLNQNLMRDLPQLRQFGGMSGAAPAYDRSTRAFVADEASYAAYVKANFGIDVGGLPIDGNVGVRVVHTELDYRDYVVDTSGVASLTSPVGRDYTEVLPSANVRFEFTPDFLLRLAYSKTLVRPEFTTMEPELTLDLNLNTGTAAGNPDIEPLISSNFDASLEYYFADSSYVSLAGFYKDVSGYTQSTIAEEIINGESYLVTRNRNGLDGKIKGFVVAYQQFFDMLPAPLDGLGISGNYTYLDSEIDDPVSGQTTPAINVAKNAMSVSALYDLGPFSARLSYNWKGKVLLGLGATPDENRYQDAAAFIDLGVSYRLNDTFTITFDATNLTSSYDNRYIGDKAYPFYSNQFGRNLQAGIRAVF